MHAKRFQSGITFIGFLFLLAIIGFFAYMAMVLVPIYSEYMGVSKAADNIAAESNSAEKPIDAIRSDINFKFSLQYVGDNSVPPQAIRVLTINGVKTLDIAYERRVHFIQNIDFVVAFHKTAVLSRAAPP